ncbi:MAG: hypothetical protein GWN57_21225 [Nitrospinaceae bacterium]|nr:hypothetical protein [Nitrospinaceae bacterium]
MKTVIVAGCAAAVLWGNPARAAFQEPVKNSCIQCHRGLPDKRLSLPVTLWAASVHAEVGNTCDGCHGGDPSDSSKLAMDKRHKFYLGPKDEEVTGFCGKCHQELAGYFKQSAHWATGTQNCIQCHGTHTVQRISMEIIDQEKCGTCHDYEPAAKLKSLLTALHDWFGQSQKKIEGIKGLPTQPLSREMDRVWNQLRQVRMISHTFDPSRYEKKAEEVEALMLKVDSEIARLSGMEKERKWLGFIFVALFAALSIATYFYNRITQKVE